MEANTISNCSRTMAATLPNTFAFWQMLAIKVWQNFMKTVRHLSRNPNTMLWRTERNKETVSWLENELWLSIFFVSWKSFASWARGIAIVERDLLCVSTWLLLFTTYNLEFNSNWLLQEVDWFMSQFCGQLVSHSWQNWDCIQVNNQVNSKYIGNKIVYTNFSKLYRLRLEDSFLPGALQNPRIVTLPRPPVISLAYARWPLPNPTKLPIRYTVRLHKVCKSYVIALCVI